MIPQMVGTSPFIPYVHIDYAQLKCALKVEQAIILKSIFCWIDFVLLFQFIDSLDDPWLICTYLSTPHPP